MEAQVVEDKDKLLTVRDVAERLQMSEYTIREWLQAEKLRGFRLGGTKAGWRIDPRDLAQFLADRANKKH